MHKFERSRNGRPTDDTTTVDGGSGGGDDGGMDTSQRLTAIETLMPTLATKADVAELRLATKADMADLRADLHKMDASIKTWMIATIIGLFFGFAGLFFTMSNSLRPTSTPAPLPIAPIVIQVPVPQAIPANPVVPPHKP